MTERIIRREGEVRIISTCHRCPYISLDKYGGWTNGCNHKDMRYRRIPFVGHNELRDGKTLEIPERCPLPNPPKSLQGITKEVIK